MLAMSDRPGDPPGDPGELITQAEAARRAGVTRATVNYWLKRGLLTVYVRKMDGRRLIDADELARKLVTMIEGEQTSDESK